MFINIQRVSSASVEVKNVKIGSIKKGLLCLVCVVPTDTKQTCEKAVNKIIKLRIFNDTNGKMNNSVIEVNGSILIISQFTLAANTENGNRPDFKGAMEPKKAKLLFEYFVKLMREKKIKIETGLFGSEMKLLICNDGPMTIPIEIK